MRCVYCGGEKFTKKFVDFPLYDDGKIAFIIRDVEANVCEQCGEPYFDVAAIRRIERQAKEMQEDVT